MNDVPPTSTGPDLAVLPAAGPDSRKPGALSPRHEKYAEEFKQWMLGLNRHDFAQVRGVLEKVTRAYFKHTVKIHSPPMKVENNDDSGKTSDGASGPVLPDPPAAA